MAWHEWVPTSTEKEVVWNGWFDKSWYESRLKDGLEHQFHADSSYFSVNILKPTKNILKSDNIDWIKLQQYLASQDLWKKITRDSPEELKKATAEVIERFHIITLDLLEEFVEIFPDLDHHITPNELYDMYFMFEYYLRKNTSYNKETKTSMDPLWLKLNGKIKGVKNLVDFKEYLWDYVKWWGSERKKIVNLLIDLDVLLERYNMKD